MSGSVRERLRARATCSVRAGWVVGLGAAVLAQAVLFSILPSVIAWRLLFVLGAGAALYALIISRFHVDDMRAHPPHLGFSAPGIVRTTALASLLSAGAYGGFFAVMVWLPLFLDSERNLTTLGATSFVGFLVTGLASGYLVGLRLGDRIGRRAVFLASSICTALMVLLYSRAPLSNNALWFLGYPLGFAAAASFAGMTVFMREVWPVRLRDSGAELGLDIGRGVGATFPAVVGLLSSLMPLSRAIAIVATIAYAVPFAAALLLPVSRRSTRAM